MLADGLAHRHRGHRPLQLHVLLRGRQAGGIEVLVPDPVPGLLLGDREVEQRNDRRNPRRGHHVQRAVGHAEVRADGAEDPPLLGGKDVGRRPADVHHQDLLLRRRSGQGEDLPHRCGRRKDRGRDPISEGGIPRRVGHHVLHEQLVDGFAGRSQVLHIALGAEVLDRVEEVAVTESLPDEIPGVLIAGVDHGQARLVRELRPEFRLPHQLAEKHRAGDGLAVETAGDQEHVRPELLQGLDLAIRHAPVVQGDGVEEHGPGAEGGAFGAPGGHLPDEPRDHHGQTAAGARGEQERQGRAITRDERHAGRLFEVPQRPKQAYRHVRSRRLHGGGRFAADEPQLVLSAEEDRLGGGAADIDDQVAHEHSVPAGR